MGISSRSRGRGGNRVTAIDIGTVAVRAVEAEIRDGVTRVIKRGQAPLAADTWRDLPARRDHVAEAIRVALRAAGITPGEVVSAVPRRLATLKLVHLPPAPAEHVRNMLRFEAPQHIPFPLDEVELAFEVLPDDLEEGTLAQIAAVRCAVVADLVAAFERAGLELAGVTVTSLGLAEAVGAEALPVAAVRLDGSEFEVAVVSAGRLLYSRAATAPEGAISDAWLLAQTERTLAAYGAQTRGQPVSKLLLTGASPDVAALEAGLCGKLSLPVERLASRLVPVGGAEAGAYAVAAGLAKLSPHGQERLNLLPETRANRRAAARQRLQRVAALVVAGALLASGAWWLTAKTSADRTEQQRALVANNRLKTAQKRLAEVRAEHDAWMRQDEAIRTGLARTLPAVDVLKAVSDATPRTAVTLTQLSFERPGQVTLQGNAAQASEAMDLVVALQKSPAFRSVRLGYVGDARDENVGKPGASGGSPTAPKAPERVSFTITGVVRPVAVARVAGAKSAPVPPAAAGKPSVGARVATAAPPAAARSVSAAPPAATAPRTTSAASGVRPSVPPVSRPAGPGAAPAPAPAPPASPSAAGPANGAATRSPQPTDVRAGATPSDTPRRTGRRWRRTRPSGDANAQGEAPPATPTEGGRP